MAICLLVLTDKGLYHFEWLEITSPQHRIVVAAFDSKDFALTCGELRSNQAQSLLVLGGHEML